MPDYVLYDVTVQTITWLHVGSGEVLLQDYDYAVHAGKTWRLNLDALLEEKVMDEKMAAVIAHRPPAELLKPEDFQEDSPLFRYVISGEPRSKSAGAQVREYIKDAWDRPYLPGSSLKGALRTAILWYALRESGQRVTIHDLEDNQKFAAQNLERRHLRQAGQHSQNYDLLRALHVGDSTPFDLSALTLANAQVIGGRTQRGAPIELEAIKPGTQTRMRLKIDMALFSAWAKRYGLDLTSQQNLLEDLPRIIQKHTAHRAQRECAWCKQHGLLDDKLKKFYEQFLHTQKEGVCFLQVGWGGGWQSKTLGDLLLEDPTTFKEIATRYKLRRASQRYGAPPSASFPRTRRMVVREKTPKGPLGWVCLTFERRS